MLKIIEKQIDGMNESFSWYIINQSLNLHNVFGHGVIKFEKEKKKWNLKVGSYNLWEVNWKHTSDHTKEKIRNETIKGELHP